MVRGLDRPSNPDVVIGLETTDDAGVYRLPTGTLIVQTVDVISPIVDDPGTFGEIAAANSLSDVYAMGGLPLTALNILGFPLKDLPIEIGTEILRGSGRKVQEAGAVVIGGHTLDDGELKFGLSVTGTVQPSQLTPNSGAAIGDVLVLTKPIGTGIISTAIKRGKLATSSPACAAMIDSMRTLNAAARDAMVAVGARGATDVTGFGLGGHAMEVALASDVSLEFHTSDLPILPDALELARQGVSPGGSARNAKNYAPRASVPTDWQPLLFDPQTSGGLLVSLPQAKAEELCRSLGGARIIGSVQQAAEPRVRVLT